MLFMRGDLQHAVGTGIGDGLSGADVLLAVILDHLGAGGMAHGEEARKIAAGDDCIDQRLREGRDLMRKVSPAELQRHAADFPVAGDRVLAARDFARHAILADERMGGERVAPRRELRRLPQPQCGQMGHAEFHVVADMAERVGALVAEARGVGRPADAEAVEDQEKGTRHSASIVRP